MKGMMLHCGGKEAMLADLAAVPQPPATRTWFPVSYVDVVKHVEEKIEQVLDREIVNRQLGLGRQGRQMFGLFTMDMGDDQTGLSIGIRQSYDKSIALGLCCGAQVFVCDNLCFSGSSVRIVRKNTRNVWTDFTVLVEEAMDHATQDYSHMKSDLAVLKAAGCTPRHGAEIIGLAQYENVLAPQQATVAMQDWKRPRFVDFSRKNLWSLYNCFTQALKRGQPGRVMDSFPQVHRFFEQRVEEMMIGEEAEDIMERVENNQEADKS